MIEEYADRMIGSWKQDNFSWFDQPDDAERRCIIYTYNRDSTLREVSNAKFIEKKLSPFAEDGSVTYEHAIHWAVGWVEGYSLLVRGPNGEITPAFRAWYDIHEQLMAYPVLDEDDLSQREHDAGIEAIQGNAPMDVDTDDFPQAWEEMVAAWLYQNQPEAMEDVDGRGPYPEEDDILAALKGAGLI